MQSFWIGSPTQYLYAAVLASAVLGMVVWASWCAWVEYVERRMLAEVLALMQGGEATPGAPAGRPGAARGRPETHVLQ